MKFGTKAIHAGQRPDPTTGAIMPPIYQTSTFIQAAPGQHQGYEYARTGNPTRTALQENLAALEGAAHGVCFSSGLGAMDAVIRLLKAGDHVVCCDDVYGGTYRLFSQIFARIGMEFSFVDMADLAKLEQAITPLTKLVWVETPTNPLLKVLDLAAITAITKAQGSKGQGSKAQERQGVPGTLVVVDNTFATPYLQQPLALGADVVIHSLTKYLGGHSDVIGGVALTNNDDIAAQLQFVQNSVGAVPGPMDCFLVLRGTKTLHVRMARHCENAQAIAHSLAEHQRVARVYYPGLPSHPQHDLASRQMRNFGGMVSFELRDDTTERAARFCSATRVFSLAESLGGVESLVEHPAIMTHASIPKDIRESYGLRDSLVRLSVGIEDIEDLLEDIEQALAAAHQ